MVLFKKKRPAKPPYLDRIDEHEHVNVVRLKGKIGRQMVPLIEARIRQNRRKGDGIEKNIIIDYALVTDVDTATVAFHLVRLKEYEGEGFKIGFLNVSDKLRALLNMFQQGEAFRMYDDEIAAIKELNR